MRKFKTFFALMSVIFIAITACDEIEQTELTLDLSKKATVRAYLYAQLDQTIQGLEFAPNGTKVIVSIPNSSFNSAATGNWVDSATVNNGMIEIQVPATSTGVTVTFTPAEFTYNQVQAFGSNTSSILKLYKSTTPGTLTAVKPAQVRTHEITYDDITSFDNFVEKVDLKFEARANVDENVADEFVPASTVVNIYTSSWSTTATVGAGGRFDVSVPKGETISFRFEANKALIGPPTAIKKYRYTTTYSAPSNSTPVLQSLDFGNGVLWE
jgi:hypothetical protein